MSKGIKLGPLELKNPVMAASGTFGLECVPYVKPDLLGAVVTRSITLHPQPGPPSPRMLETPSGLLSAVEVQSEGVEAFLEQELPLWKRFSVTLIANIAGTSPIEYFELATLLGQVEGIAALELNLHHLYLHLKTSFLDTLVDVVSRVKRLAQIPVIAKLFPFYAIGLLARRCEEAGADILSLVHGFPGVSFDPKTGRSRLGSERGILTGPAIKPMALNLVWEVRHAVRLPIIGMGGIFSGQDALEFLNAGASAVAVGTATLVNPRALLEILEAL